MCPVSAERNRRDPKRISFADLRKYLRMALREDGGSDSEGEGEAGEGEEIQDDEESGEEGGEGQAKRIKEVKWSVPDGFEVAGEPAALDSTLVGKHVYMRWETYGWQLGKITAVVTKDTPRLFKSFNFRCIWADGKSGPAKLGVDNYAYGPDARLNSWVILEPAS